MKNRFFVLAGMLYLCMSANAQIRRTPTPDDTLQHIRVQKDGSVVFSLYAPKARTVSIVGDEEFKTMLEGYEPIVKEANGVWTLTYGHKPNGDVVLPDGFYRYNFVVDGIKVYDPHAEWVSEASSVGEIKRADSYYDIKDVPHGAVHQRYYYSQTTKSWRRMHVWTPAGYETGKQKLPVLYLVHGGGHIDDSWTDYGRANFILDNLMAEGKMVPMIVVMPNGSIKTEEGYFDEVPLFERDMMTDIIPYIEKNYRVLTDKDHRAMAGLSMGGMETLETTLKNIDKFSYVWVLSSSFNPRSSAESEAKRLNLKENSDKINKSFKQLVFTQGGPLDIAYKNNINTRKEFDKAGIKYEYPQIRK
ncbi:MAG: alpha/beta hydrolase-fold protein [Bacteroidales bacterium]|nr:alpha/beta hydrolase-fold protein [Bacteroidales bacterium]